MEVDQRLSHQLQICQICQQPMLKEEVENQDHLTTAGMERKTMLHQPKTAVDPQLSHQLLLNKEIDHSPIMMVLLPTTVPVPVLSHQFLMSQSTPTTKLDQLQLERPRRVSQRKESMKMFTISLTISQRFQDFHTQDPKSQ